MQYRGVVYDVGLHFEPNTPSVDPFSPYLVEHDMRTIADDLHANAVRIEGESIARLVTAARAAHARGLAVLFNPWKMHSPADEVRAYLAEAARAAEELRAEGVDVVFVAQCEFTIFNEGIFPGETLMERVGWMVSIGQASDEHLTALGRASAKLNGVLRLFLDVIRPVFHGRVTYSAGSWEQVAWAMFDIVGVDYYRHSEPEAEYVDGLDKYRLGKSPSRGAGGFALLEGTNVDGTGKFADGVVPTYSETEQADYIETQLGLLADAAIDGAFVYVFSFPTYRAGQGARNLDMMSFSLVKTWPEDDERCKRMPPWSPKESFERLASLYKSMQDAGLAGDNSLTYFSETRLKSLSQCLGHDRVRALVERISGTVNLHMRTIVNFSSNMGTRQAKTPGCLSDKALYFERVHPRFPFLDRAAFEATAASQGQPNVIPRSKSWTALFHTVLALGSEYAGGGSFEPGKGESWELFSVALANYTDLMLLPDSLTTLQAFTAMTIYALGMSSVGLDQIIMSEAVRRAQNLQEARFSGNATDAFRRTFWSLYCLEKITSFHHGRSSGFVDCDIACPIPYAQDSIFGAYNWFLSFIKHARLLSRAYTSLFAIGVSDNPDEYYLDIIDQLSEELEEWRVSIPDTGFRPGGVLKPHRMEGESLARTCAVSIHFFYYSFLQTVSRMALRHLPASQVAKREAVLITVEHASRSLIELTPLIEVAPYTPLWMLAGIPVAGFFVLFDITIHNPRSPLATSNLALLDIVAGHSSQLEYMSKGIIPGSVIGEFAHIARNYVNDVGGGGGGGGGSSTGNTPPRHTPENSQYLYSQPYWSLPQAVTQSMVAMDVTADFSDMNLVTEGEQTDSIESMDIEGLPMPPSNVMGTDVMGLFGFWVPDMDPLLYQGLTGQNDPLHGTPQADNAACIQMS
ncbi:Fusaridione A cluster transcription factor fsdR [Colletotrichum sidae]|uniref:Fusaridione A cluster transcription factor fsdR n=1 Tax=Colletotrichum sidae TaxID=1347389 RepID=A0A4R8TB88_9PEZI|nr:Fusaridione A cluster transcription factor fsdR [Colletotrichum sidae]